MAEPKNIGVSSPFAHKIQIEGIARDIQQLDFIRQALVEALAEQLRQLRVVKRHILLLHARFCRGRRIRKSSTISVCRGGKRP